MPNKITNPVVDRETGKVRGVGERPSMFHNYLLRKYFLNGMELGKKLCKKEQKVKKMKLNVYTTDEFRKLEDVVLELIDVIGDGITMTESAPMMITTPNGKQLLIKIEVKTVKWAQHDIDRMKQRLYHKQRELDEMINKSAQR